MGNKYHYDVLNCHYFKGTRAADGSITFATPAVALPGLMSFEGTVEGDVTKIRADGVDYLVLASPTGGSLTLNFVMIPDQFKQDCMCEAVNSIGLHYLDVNKDPAPFALVGEFKGDEKNIRWIWYNCVASVPGMAGDNKEQIKSPDTESVSVTASPYAYEGDTPGDYYEILRGAVEPDTTNASSDQNYVYNNWFNEIFLPGIALSSSDDVEEQAGS